MVCIVVATAAAFAAKPELGEVASALICVLGITITGALFGLAPALIAALALSLVFNFYLTEPVLTFSIATGADLTPFVVYNLCALVTGLLAGRLQNRAQAADRSNLLLSNLLETSRGLQSAVRLHDVGDILTGMTPGWLGASLRVFGVRDGDVVALHAQGAPPAFEAAARAALRDRQPVFVDNLIGHRLDSNAGPVGVIVREDTGANALDENFFVALGNLVTIAIERATLSEAISESRAHARTEELKTALLASISHDFRTPMTAISASASSLIAYRAQLDQKTTLKLLQGIVDECERLNRYTANLLEMSRLEAGQSAAHRQTLDVVEILSAVLRRVRPRAGARVFERTSDDSTLAVVADVALFELMLVNVLDNAIAYSGDPSTIRIDARRDGETCRITISDEGEGIPPADLDRVFERFYRVPRSETPPRGSGLGLAIAKGFVEALGGRIEARVPGIGARGTSIVIVLPLAEIVDPS